MKSVAIIPARVGSKRIPEKNIRLFHSKPMIAYSIEAAIQCGLFQRVIVSTDSEKIAEVAVKCGAEVPFFRPENLSDDRTPLADVLLHALTWLNENDSEIYHSACCLLATAPFVQQSDIHAGYKKLEESGVSSVVPVTSFPFPIFRGFKMDQNSRLQLFWPEHELTRSNDLPEAFHDVGQFYWLKISEFLKQKKIFTPDAQAILIPRFRVQDIDTLEDWDRAEKLYSVIEKNS